MFFTLQRDNTTLSPFSLTSPLLSSFYSPFNNRYHHTMTHQPPVVALPPLDFQDTPVEDLEQIRPRLTQLTHTLRKLETSLRQLRYNPTPKGSTSFVSATAPEIVTIQNQFNVAIQQLASLSKTLQQRSNSLLHTVVYPNRDFDTMSPFLFTLLRKKLTPEVEEWIKQANETTISQHHPHTDSTSAGTSTIPNTSASYSTTAATTHSANAASPSSISAMDALQTLIFETDEVTDSLIEHAHEALEEYIFGGYLTQKEIDNGKTAADVLGIPSDMSDSENDQTKDTTTATTAALAETDILKFIYQGLDSGTKI